MNVWHGFCPQAIRSFPPVLSVWKEWTNPQTAFSLFFATILFIVNVWRSGPIQGEVLLLQRFLTLSLRVQFLYNILFSFQLPCLPLLPNPRRSARPAVPLVWCHRVLVDLPHLWTRRVWSLSRWSRPQVGSLTRNSSVLYFLHYSGKLYLKIVEVKLFFETLILFTSDVLCTRPELVLSSQFSR